MLGQLRLQPVLSAALRLYRGTGPQIHLRLVVGAVLRDLAGGTLQCVITVKDEFGSRYQVPIPAQEAHTHQA